jgi:hypothetical protein
MTRRLLPFVAFSVTLMTAAFMITQAGGYPIYSGGPACDDCHSGFGGFGEPLHDLHNEMTSSCQSCHGSIGDNPATETCAGCHVSGSDGGGLVIHHTNAEAPPDLNGERCATCHPDAEAQPEDVAPPLYGTADVSLTDPCETDTGAGGEDYDGDGFGLDNDGDLAYDTADSDCGLVPTEPITWGRVKAIYE